MRKALLCMFLIFGAIFSQNVDVSKFESILGNRTVGSPNAQMPFFNNSAAISFQKHKGIALYNSLDSKLWFVNLTLIGISTGLLVDGGKTEKFYLASSHRFKKISIGASMQKGFHDFSGYDRYSLSIDADLKYLFAGARLNDISVVRYSNGFSDIGIGFSSNALWHKLNIFGDIDISAGNESFAKNVYFSAGLDFNILNRGEIFCKYDSKINGISIGLTYCYGLLSSSLLGNYGTGDYGKNYTGSAIGFEFSNRSHKMKFSQDLKSKDYMKNLRKHWKINADEPSIVIKKLSVKCPKSFGFLKNENISTYSEMRREIENKFYTLRFDVGELSGGNNYLSAGPNRIVRVQSVIDTSKYPIISVSAVVTDTAGNFISGLTADDFSFPGDSIEIISAREIDSTFDVPVDIVFVLDESGSMFDDIKSLRKNIHNFAEKLDNSGIDYRLGLVTFGNKVDHIFRPVSDVDAFDYWLSKPLKGGFREVDEDAIVRASKVRFRKNAQKLIILATDEYIFQGNSHHNDCDVISALFDNGINFYEIINPFQADGIFLTWLTFGRTYYLDEDISSILDDIGKNLRQKYIITYRTKVPQDKLAKYVSEPPGENIAVVSGKVTDVYGKPIPAEIVWQNLETGKPVKKLKNAKDTGTYQVELQFGNKYGFYAESDGYYSISGNIDLTDEKGTQYIHQDIVMTPVKDILKGKASVVLKNIFFKFDSDSLLPESFSELNRLVEFMKKHPEIDIEIAGHTDSIGAEDYNMDLSRRRANSVKNYLISQGIDSKRLIARGYGESRPIADNGTPEGRAMNRRVEFKVVK